MLQKLMILRRSKFLPIAAVIALVFAPAQADEVGHEQARRLLEQGAIRPLQDIIAIVRAKVPGKLIETELEYENDGLVYDFKILRPGGRVQEVEVDAKTGRIIKIEDDD